MSKIALTATREGGVNGEPVIWTGMYYDQDTRTVHTSNNMYIEEDLIYLSPRADNYSLESTIIFDYYQESPGVFKVVTHEGNGNIDIGNSSALNDLVEVQTIDCTTYGGNDGQAFFTYTHAGITVTWPNGLKGNRTDLLADDYVCTLSFFEVTDTKTITIEQPEGSLIVGLNITHATCFGTPTGAMTVFSSGGVAPHIYQWLHGPTTEALTALLAGEYTCTVTDANGVSITKTGTVLQPDPITISAIIEDQTITVIAKGGTAPYTYLWDNGQQGAILENAIEGLYKVTVTDANGCAESAGFEMANSKFYYAENPIILELSADDIDTKPNFTFLCECYIEEQYLSNQFKKVLEVEHPSNDNNSTQFDFRKTLDGYFNYSPPVFESKMPFLATEHFRRFYLYYSEKYGDIPKPDSFSQGVIHYALNGGITQDAYANKIQFEAYQEIQKPFLSWQPKTKLVRPSQQEFLYWHNQNGYTEFEVKVSVQYHNDDIEIFIIESFFTAKKYEVYGIPVGFDQLNLRLKEIQKKVLSWTVYLSSAGNEISEKRTYRLDSRQVYPNELFLLYRNSLGAYETFRALGHIKEAVKVKTQTYEKKLPHDATITQRRKGVSFSSRTNTIEFSSGYMVQETLSNLQDFMLSKDVYLIADNAFLPVIIQTSKVLLNDTMQPEWYLKGTIEFPEEEKFSPFN